MNFAHFKFSLVAVGFILLLIGESGCGTAPQTPSADSATAAQAPSSGSSFVRANPIPAAGSYGGSGILLTPQSPGQTAVQENCANGTIPVDLKLLRDGETFEADGTWVSRSGPITPAGHPTLPAHYTGGLDGSHLHLSVTIASGATGSPQTQTYDAYAGEPAVDHQACPL